MGIDIHFSQWRSIFATLASKKAVLVRGERSLSCNVSKVIAGNLGPLASAEVLRKINSERKCADDYHEHDFLDLYMQQSDEIENEDEFIRLLARPFTVVFFFDEQLETFLAVRSTKRFFFTMHLDATGSIVRRPQDAPVKPYYYALVVNVEGLLLSLAEFLLCCQKAISIANCLSVFKSRFSDLSQAWPPTRIVTVDGSAAMMQGVCKGLNDIDLGTYIQYAEAVSQGIADIDTKKIGLANCVSHLVKLFAVLVGNSHFPNMQDLTKNEKKIEVRIATRMLCCLIVCETFDNFLMSFDVLCNIFLSPYMTDNLQQEIQDLERGHFADQETEDLIEELEDETTDVTRKYYETLREKSKCFLECTSRLQKAKDVKRPLSEELNPYFCESVLDDFVKRHSHSACIWSGFFHRAIGCKELTFSNADAENAMRSAKAIQESSNEKAGRVVRKLKKKNKGVCMQIKMKAFPKPRPKKYVPTYLHKKPRLAKDAAVKRRRQRSLKKLPAVKKSLTTATAKLKKAEQVKQKFLAKQVTTSNSEDEPAELHEAKETWGKRGTPLPLPKKPSVVKRTSRSISTRGPQELHVGEKIDTFEGKYKDCSNADLQRFERDLSCDRNLMSEMIKRYPRLSTPDNNEMQVSKQEKKRKKAPTPSQSNSSASSVMEEDDVLAISDADDGFQMIENAIVAGGVNFLLTELACLTIKTPLAEKDLYLGGEIISAYTNLMMNEAAKVGGKIFHFDCMLLACTLAHSTTYSKLLQEKRAISCPLWIMPAHVAEGYNHWLLYIIDWLSQTITCLDSLRNYDNVVLGPRKYLPAIRLLLNTAYQSKNSAPFDGKVWKVYFPTDTPIQTNRFDCGLYVCYWSEMVCKGQSADILSEELIENLSRKKIYNRILAGENEEVQSPCIFSKIGSFHVERSKTSRSTFSEKTFTNTVPGRCSSTEEYLMTLVNSSKS